MRYEYLIGYVYGLLETWELDLGILERTRFVWRWVLDTTYHEGRIDSGSSRMSDLLLIHHFLKRLICYVDVREITQLSKIVTLGTHVSEPHGMSWNRPTMHPIWGTLHKQFNDNMGGRSQAPRP